MSEEFFNNLQHCKECGTLIKPDEKLCPNCGIAWGKPDLPNADEPVLLKIFVDEKDAAIAIKNLEANRIVVTKVLKPWPDNSLGTDLYVLGSDLEKANKVLELINKKPNLMFLADIFSNTFTAAGKSIVKNLITVALFIPAGLLAAFCINSFFSSIYKDKADKNTAYVYVEVADTMDITREYNANGFIDINKNAVVEVSELDTSFVQTGDTVWVYYDEEDYHSYSGGISSIEQFSKPSANNINNSLKYRLIIKIFEPDEYVIADRHCEVEIDGETRTNVIGVDHNSINIEEDSSSIKSAGTEDYVYILNNNKSFKVKVVTGINGDDYTEIISGLSAGDSVIYDTSSVGRALADGVKASAEIPDGEAVLHNIPVNISLLLLGLLLIVLTNQAVTIGITKSAASHMDEKQIAIKEIFVTMFSLTFLRSIGATIVTLAVASFPFLMVIIIVALFSAQNNPLMTGIAATLFFPAAVFAIFIFIKWGFSAVHIVVTGEPILDSIKKSSDLVKGLWWRTFGIIMLTSLVVSFIVSLISTPVSFIFMWDYISNSMQSSFAGNSSQDAQSSAEMFRSMGWGFTLTIVFNYMMQSLIAPIFYVVMYYDLKIRKNDYLVKLDDKTLNTTEPSSGKPAI